MSHGVVVPQQKCKDNFIAVTLVRGRQLRGNVRFVLKRRTAHPSPQMLHVLSSINPGAAARVSRMQGRAMCKDIKVERLTCQAPRTAGIHR